MQKYEVSDRRPGTLNLDLIEVGDRMVRLHEYLEMLEARNIRELKQLDTTVGRLKTKVNGRRAKLGLPSLG
jgi:hypothetical protein